MKNFFREWWWVIALVAGTLLFFWGIAYQSDKYSLAQYEQCKAHTTDLEWCFKQCQPNFD